MIITVKSVSVVWQDRYTILCALTLKSYAPKCKQYVHISRPENKMHLHMAGGCALCSIVDSHSVTVLVFFFTDEIICEKELTNSLLAMNAICPGMSTVASLLMHTFTYE